MLKESRYVRLANTMYRVLRKDTLVSSQKELPCIYDVAASDIAHNKTVRCYEKVVTKVPRFTGV
jgi:hypothetical protein